MGDEPNPNKRACLILYGPSGGPPSLRIQKSRQEEEAHQRCAARELRDIFDVPPEDEDDEDIHPNARRTPERPASAVMPPSTPQLATRAQNAGGDTTQQAERNPTRLNSNIFGKHKMENL